MLRSAAAMQAANNTLDETIALATAANKIVQNPQIVGTTLKTVSMFLRAAKTEAQEAGEETDGMADSVSKLRGEILALTGNKVDIQIDENTFKSTYQILKELSEVWGELTDVTQANILERIGGKRNANVVSALLNNFTTAEEALEVSVNSLNSAAEENEKVLASIQGRINLFKSSFEVLSQTVVNGDLVKVAIDSGTWILNTITSITKLIDSLGGLKTVLLAVGAAISFIPGVSNKLATALTGLFKLIVSLDTVGFGGLKAGLLSIIKIIPTAITMWRAYSHGIVTAQAAMQATMPVIGLLVTAITGVVAVISKVKQAEADRRSAAIEAGRQAKTESEEILGLLSSYEDLNEKIKTDESVKKDLESATDAIIKKLGLEKDAVEQLGDSYEETTKKIRQKAVSQLAEQQRELVDAYTSAGKDLVDTQRTGLTYGRTTNANMAEVWEAALNEADREVIKRLEDLGLISGTRRGSQRVLGAGSVNTLQLIGSDNLSTAEGVYDAYERLGKILDILNTSTGTSQALYDAVYKEYDNLRNAADSYSSSLTGLNDNLAAQQFILSEISGKELPNTVEEFEQYRKAMVDGAQYARVFGGDINDIEKAVDNLLRSDSRFKQFFERPAAAGENAGPAGYAEPIRENIKAFNEYKRSIGDLGRALDEFNETGSVSSNTYKELVTGNEKYADLFKFTGEGIELQTDKLNTYIETLGQEYGAKMAMAGATQEDIQLMNALGETLVTVAEDNSNVASEIEELSGTLKEMNAGNKLTSSQMSALVKKYPKLEGAVKDLGDGYTIEADAIRELIELKAQYLSLTDRETEVVKARNALNLSNNGNTTAVSKIDEIFKKYEELHGKAISSIEEFRQGYAEVFGEAYTGGYEAYERYVEALIAQNQDLALSESYVEDALNATNDALEDTAKSMSDVQSELDNLSTVLGELNEGREYGTSEMITLLSKYPSLRNHIIKTANGYKIETSAIKELIAAKVQLISTQDSEMSIRQARTALTTVTKDANADKADAVFADFLAKNGRNISTIEEYKEAYKAYYGYAAKASKVYAQARIDAFAAVAADDVMTSLYYDYIDGTPLEGYDPSKEEKSSSSTSEDVETEFEKAYKIHQHYLAIDKETEEQYLNWLEGAYKASYDANEMELDDYYRYEEEVYEKRKELFTQSLNETQHQIDLLSHRTGDTSAEQIALYEQMQKKLNQQANAYRARGIKDNDELIRELQNQWWQYEDNIRQLRENAFNDWLNDRKFVIDQLKQDDASSDEIVRSWKEVLVRINEEIAYYLSKGHDITSDVIQSLMKELEDAKNSITDALEEIVSKANEVVDGFQNVYTTLTNAAKEYASTGYLSVDSLQSILELGPKYMDMLYDESGQLMINEEALQKVIAARTEEMAAETALSYAKQVLLATEGDESQKLKELTDVQAASSAATWDMAYATLGYARALGATKGISEDYYNKAIQYVTRMQSVTKTATDSISAYYKTLDEGYVSQADGLETILKLTEDMLKQENSDRIKQLEDEKDAYKDIIDQKKEILRLTKEQQNHDRDMADKLKEISDLQSKIDQLALDDSREARAQRAKLEEQLLEKQRDLADDQADYAIEAQEDALDKQYDAYEKEKDKEIDALKDELNSAEKLYRAAIDRISNGWDTLYSDLLNWNYNYGNTLEKDLTKAWEAAKAAAERYGDFVSAMEGVRQHDELGPTSTRPTDEAVQNAVSIGAEQFGNGQRIIDQMRANSIAWFTGDQEFLSGENQRLANDYRAATGRSLDYRNGFWYEEGSSTPIYDLSKDQAARNQIGNAVVAAMKTNSALWKSSDQATRRELERKNEDLAAKLANFLGRPITKTQGGVWMMGDTPLYEITKFHTGGIVGGRGSLRQNEVMALLKKGETVLDEKREQALYKTVDFVQVLSDKIGHAIDKGMLSSLLAGTGPSITKNLVPALVGGGVGTMNFSPTISVTIAGAGDLNESTARKYGTIAANTALEQLKSAFTQRGVSAAGNSILK